MKPTSAITPNPAQDTVIAHRHPGNILVNAGAGTGKTRTLTLRFERALRDDPDLSPGKILAITYTNAAAEELRSRVQAQLRLQAMDPHADPVDAARLLAHARAMDQAWILTFHAFCLRVIRAHAFELGIDPHFGQLDDDEAQTLRREVLARFALSIQDSILKGRIGDLDVAQLSDASTEEVAQIVHTAGNGDLYTVLIQAGWSERQIQDRMYDIIETCSKYGRTTQEVESQPWEYATDEVARANIFNAMATIELTRRYAHAYQAEKLARGMLDYDDLIAYTSQLFTGHPEIAQSYRTRFSHIMIDEFQDTNRVLFDIIGHIADDNLCVVGDVKQSIFNFTGADATLITGLDRSWADEGEHRVVELSINYRSSADILDFVNTFCSHDEILGEVMQGLSCGKAAGDYPYLEHLDTPRVCLVGVSASGNQSTTRIEATVIAEQLQALFKRGVPLDQMAVIVGTGTQANAVLNALEQLGLRGSVEGGKTFFQETIVTEALAFLRLARNPHDDQAFLEVALSPLGNLSDGILAALEPYTHADQASDSPRSLFEAATKLVEAVSSDEEQQRNLGHFLDVIRRATTMANSHSPAEILSTACRDRGVFDLWEATAVSTQRDRANFEKLLRIADAHYARSVSLVGFIESLQQAQETGRAEALGQMMARDEQSISIMTVHKAKGREFPVVAYLGEKQAPRKLGKSFAYFNDDAPAVRGFIEEAIEHLPKALQAPAREQWARHTPGAIIYSTTVDDLRQPRNALHHLLRAAQYTREYEEMKRRFYVATTRAEEQLLVTYRRPKNAPSHDGRHLGAALGSICQQTDPSPRLFENRTEDYQTFWESRTLLPEHEPDASASAPRPALPLRGLGERPAFCATPDLVQVSASQIRTFTQCRWQYWWVYGKRLFTNRNAILQAADDAHEETASASLKGTVVHKLLELASSRDDTTRHLTRAEAETIMRTYRVPEDESDGLWKSVETFCTSELSERLSTYPVLHKEYQFYFALDAYYLYGYMDAYAQDADGGALIVDYKVSDSDEDTSESYRKQEHVYALVALSQGAKTVQVIFAQISEEKTHEHGGQRVYTRDDLEELRTEILTDIEQMQQVQTAPPHKPPQALCAFCPVPKTLCRFAGT